MKKLIQLAGSLASAAALAAMLFTSSVFAQTTSPNGFQAPQCTWFVDLNAAANGWQLKFAQNWGRDARYWPQWVLNARCGLYPLSGSILVLDVPGVPEGHVVWVESFTGQCMRDGSIKVTGITVLHSNFRAGTIVKYIAGVPIRRTYFECIDATHIRVPGGTTVLTIRAILQR
jgi:surface antigen